MRGLKSLFVLATSSCIVASCSPPVPVPDSRREPVIDVVHGVTFQDDYRWLEDQEVRSSLIGNTFVTPDG